MRDPITTLGLAKTSIDVIREAVQVAREAKRPDLTEELLDAYQNLLDVMESNRELREEIAELKKAAAISENLVFDVEKGAYLFRRVPDGQQDGPFCGTSGISTSSWYAGVVWPFL